MHVQRLQEVRLQLLKKSNELCGILLLMFDVFPQNAKHPTIITPVMAPGRNSLSSCLWPPFNQPVKAKRTGVCLHNTQQTNATEITTNILITLSGCSGTEY